MNLKKLASQAQKIIENRGGTEALKQDAEELKKIATGEGSVTDKAKAAVDALKDPGKEVAETDEPTAAEQPAATDDPAAAEEAPQPK